MKTTRPLNQLKILIVSLSCAGLWACKMEAPQAPDVQPEQTVTPPAGNMGSSSGGGGFADETARIVVQISATELAKEIRRANPEIFGNLPKGWTPTKMASILENVRFSFDQSRQRDERDLAFDYGYDQEATPYIEVLRAFSLGMTGVVYDTLGVERRRELIDSTKLRLAHELMHLLDYGLTEENDIEARAMAYRLIQALDSDTVSCTMAPDYPESFPDLAYESLKSEDETLEMREDFVRDNYNRADRSAPVLAFTLDIHFPSGLGRGAFKRTPAYLLLIKGSNNRGIFSGLIASSLFSDLDRREGFRFGSGIGFFRGPTLVNNPVGFETDHETGIYLKHDDSTIIIGEAVQYWGWQLHYDPSTSTAVYSEFIDTGYAGKRSVKLNMNCNRRVAEFILTLPKDQEKWAELLEGYKRSPEQLRYNVEAHSGWRD